LIRTEDLVHDYGPRRALDALTLDVPAGERFGLLGPNGGGKTTLFRVLATLLVPAGGRAEVAGLDVVGAPAAVRRRLGVVFQAPGLDGKLTVRENLRCQGALYGLPRRESARRADAMLARVGVAERADERGERLSGGLRRRVELAKGLLHEPDVLLLDEPTTGLDPGARRDVWTYLRSLEGVTCLVTTHLMEEAEKCDRVGILDRGRLVALGRPDELKAELGGESVTVGAREPEAVAADLRARLGIDAAVVDGTVRFQHADAAALVPRIAAELGERVESVTLGRPTLEDVFVARTGHRFTEAEA